jgi:hypothetical protein
MIKSEKSVTRLPGTGQVTCSPLNAGPEITATRNPDAMAVLVVQALDVQVNIDALRLEQSHPADADS